MYDAFLALECAKRSAEVYLGGLAFDGEILDDPDRRFISEDGTQVFMMNGPNQILIAFRGTTYEDLMAVLKLGKEATPHGAVHRGFLDYARQVFETIHKTVVEWGREKPLVLTGHSLGGAAALITAAFLHGNGFNVSALYTFGAPRVGDHQFQKYVDAAFLDRHFRHVNGHDGVPLVPWCFGTYRHAGQLVYFSTKGQKRNTKAKPFKVILERLPLLFTKPWSWARSKRIDHAVFLYVAACHKNLEG